MKLWGGRFTKNTDKLVEEFSASLTLDKRLFQEDIEGSLAHAKMLGETGIITTEEAEQIRGALMEIRLSIESGAFVFDLADEDIHMAIERALIDKIGPVGGKLHTARSRNDQVATDMRLHLMRTIVSVSRSISDLRAELLLLAEKNRETVLPGYTHLQRAQPIFLAHHFLAYVFMFDRDARRLAQCYEEADVMPLGSAALAGTALPIDRELVAAELGFSKISSNSMDAVSDRDFLVQFLSAGSQIMIHLSRLAEEMIVWSSSEFDFIEIDDGFTTGSSIMPQKKNPDVAELIRGKAGRAIGGLTGMLALLKGLPLTYNRDLQEDKTYMFDMIDTVSNSLAAMTGMLTGLTIKTENLAEAAGGFAVATDYADYLVLRGVPFRSAHAVVGKLVKWCLDNNTALADLTLDQLQQLDLNFGEDALMLANPHASAAGRDSLGGTGSSSIEAQLKMAAGASGSLDAWIEAREPLE